MTDSLPLGRIAGIRVGLNWSVLVIAAYLVFALNTSIFPSTNPDIGGNTRLAMSISAAVLFLLSILLHEIGHAVQARRDGMRIDGITLWMFGGVAKFRGMFPSAGAEFRIAIAGPLVSLALGLGCMGISGVGGIPEPVDAVAAWLAYINLALLVFNMLPALPMDGGRVLRSILWARTDNFAKATRIAGSLGRGFGGLMMAGGLFMAFAGGSAFSGIWLAVIGLFLLQASAGETRAAVAHDALRERTVGELMEPQPLTVQASASLDEFAAFARWTGAGTMTYPVLDGDRPVGIFPTGVLMALPEGHQDTPISSLMIPMSEIPVFTPETPALDAVEALRSIALRQGLVLEDGRLVGLITLDGLAQAVRETAGQPSDPVEPPA
ncbi:MAG: site-2 protease family protein [Thermoleophilia bacterium]